MFMRFALATLPFLAISGAALACGGAPICTVADPTATPLNIRKSPNGSVVGTAANGTQLEFIEHQDVNGERWALVARFNAGELASDLGGAWVFGAYITCDGTTLGLPAEPYSAGDVQAVSCTVTDPTGSPLNARYEPGGEIDSTLRNGTVVQAIAQKQHAGDQWVFVEKWSSDNAVGWVFDAFMACEETESH
ncbi:MAG: SH3 domain-containing protein [Paracoccaceae bacterium]